jgi:hypothetical protein
MDTVEPGMQLEVTDALGRTFVKYALSQVERAGAFPVLWACSEQEWTRAHEEDDDPNPEPFPWPLRSVRVLVA